MATSVIVQSLPDYTHAQLVAGTGRAFVADEPADEGGNGLGLTPYELLASALGTCTAMTLQMYARRKSYPLVEIAVQVEFERIHADDCKECTENPDRGPRVERFNRRIVLRGALDDAQRDDLLRVARRCPVHRSLTGGPQVVDTVEVVA